MPQYCEVDIPPYWRVDIPPYCEVDNPPPGDVRKLRGQVLERPSHDSILALVCRENRGGACDSS